MPSVNEWYARGEDGLWHFFLDAGSDVFESLPMPKRQARRIAKSIWRLDRIAMRRFNRRAGETI